MNADDLLATVLNLLWLRQNMNRSRAGRSYAGGQEAAALSRLLSGLLLMLFSAITTIIAIIAACAISSVSP